MADAPRPPIIVYDGDLLMHVWKRTHKRSVACAYGADIESGDIRLLFELGVTGDLSNDDQPMWRPDVCFWPLDTGPKQTVTSRVAEECTRGTRIEAEDATLTAVASWWRAHIAEQALQRTKT